MYDARNLTGIREQGRQDGIEAALRFLHERYRWKADTVDRFWEDYWAVKVRNDVGGGRKNLKRERTARRLYDVAMADKTELWLAISSLERAYREGTI